MAEEKKRYINRFELSKQQKKDMKDAFDIFDVAGIGMIDCKELKVAIRALGFEPNKTEIRKMIADVDKEESGQLSYENFVELLAMKMSEQDSEEDILKAFRLFDEEEKGKINFENIRRVANAVGEDVTDEQIMQMIEEADEDDDNVVSLKEFKKFMKHSTLFL
nr:caltractin-like [Onthophagus taurus]